MRDVPRLIACLPRVGGPLPITVLAGDVGDDFDTGHTTTRPLVQAAVLHDGSQDGHRAAMDHAAVLSAAPVMLGLLAGVLARWGEAVEADTEIDGGDAVDWLSSFAIDVRAALEQLVGPEAPETPPLRR